LNFVVKGDIIYPGAADTDAGKGEKPVEDTRTCIIRSAIIGVRKYGLEGVRIQNISEIAGLSPGAMYRYFKSKDELITACFTFVDKQAAAIFNELRIEPEQMAADPVRAVKSLWLPYFRFWTSHPDETVFYHRFRDSEMFPAYDRQRDVSYFSAFVEMVNTFYRMFPRLEELGPDLIWLHVLTSTVLFAKYVVTGVLPNTPETEETVFGLLMTGLGPYLEPARV